MRKILNVLYRMLQVLITVLMAVLIIPVAMQILSRFTGIIPRYIWTEEVARFCFMWIVMLGAMIAVRDDEHFDVDVLPKAKTPIGQAISRIIVHLIMLIMAFIFGRYGYDFAKFGYVQSSELTGINMLTIHIAYPLAGIIWTLFLAEKIYDDIAIARGGQNGTR